MTTIVWTDYMQLIILIRLPCFVLVDALNKTANVLVVDKMDSESLVELCGKFSGMK